MNVKQTKNKLTGYVGGYLVSFFSFLPILQQNSTYTMHHKPCMLGNRY